MESIQVTFDLADREHERSFLQQYMGEAWDRFDEHETFDRGWFWCFGSAGEHGTVELEDGTSLEGGGVVLVLNGESLDPLVEAERPYWRDLRSDGILDAWDVKSFEPAYDDARRKSIENFGRVGGERAYRIRPLASRLTLDVLEEFDEDLPAVGTESDENPVPVGYWTMIHYLMKQGGYDWYEEIDACVKAIENRLRSLAAFHGEETAQEALETALADLRDADVSS